MATKKEKTAKEVAGEAKTISIELIKKLKELSGVGLTDAKKALVEAKGDFDKALAEMRKKVSPKQRSAAIAKLAKVSSNLMFTVVASALSSK